MTREQGWELAGFEDLLERWVGTEDPPVELRVVVADWIFSRYDDPFAGVQREVGHDNLWYGAVPGTRHAGSVVVCSYFVYSAEQVIAASGLATLSWPI